jgi:hypothetical protein
MITGGMLLARPASAWQKDLKMNNKILISISILFVGLSGFSQQFPNISKYRVYLLQDRDVLFNPKAINPTSLGDSNLLYLSSNLEFDRLKNPGMDYFFSCESNLKSIHSSFGLVFDVKNLGLKQRSLISSYKYRFRLGDKSNMSVGINIGMWKFKLNTPYFDDIDNVFYESENNWGYSPIINIGTSYTYQRHHFGLSYNVFSSKLVSTISEINMRPSGLIINYSPEFAYNADISIVPNLNYCIDSEDNYGIFSFAVDYRNKISCGMLFNTKNAFGLYISGIFLKRINLGYLIDYREMYNTYMGFHTLNLGILI